MHHKPGYGLRQYNITEMVCISAVRQDILRTEYSAYCTLTSGNSVSWTSHINDFADQHSLAQFPIFLHFLYFAVAAGLFAILDKCASSDSMTSSSPPE